MPLVSKTVELELNSVGVECNFELFELMWPCAISPSFNPTPFEDENGLAAFGQIRVAGGTVTWLDDPSRTRALQSLCGGTPAVTAPV